MEENKAIHIEPKSIQLEEIKQDIESVIIEFPTYVSIYVTEWYKSFKMSSKDSSVTREVCFYFDDDCLDLTNGVMESHWFYNTHRPV